MCATGASPTMAMATPAMSASLPLLMRVRCGYPGGMWGLTEDRVSRVCLGSDSSSSSDLVICK